MLSSVAFTTLNSHSPCWLPPPCGGRLLAATGPCPVVVLKLWTTSLCVSALPWSERYFRQCKAEDLFVPSSEGTITYFTGMSHKINDQGFDSSVEESSSVRGLGGEL